jgi:hypothetical protein
VTKKLANDGEEVKGYFNMNFFLEKRLILVKFDLHVKDMCRLLLEGVAERFHGEGGRQDEEVSTNYRVKCHHIHCDLFGHLNGMDTDQGGEVFNMFYLTCHFIQYYKSSKKILKHKEIKVHEPPVT